MKKTYVIAFGLELEDEWGMPEAKLDEWARYFRSMLWHELKTECGKDDDEAESPASIMMQRTPTFTTALNEHVLRWMLVHRFMIRNHRCMVGAHGRALETADGKWHCSHIDFARADPEDRLAANEDEAWAWCVGQELADALGARETTTGVPS